jgi:outer membrane immunogenic protein
MKLKSLLPLALSASLFSPVAQASEKDPRTAYDWSGFYAGLNAGFVKNKMTITDVNATSFYASLQEVTNPKGTVGVQAGWRRQLKLAQASGVYGVEVSANLSDAQNHRRYGSPFALYEFETDYKLKNVYLLEVIGGIAADRALLFLSAGVSWNRVDGNMTTLDSVPFFSTVHIKPKNVGAAVGGGVEYAFNDTLSARVKVDVICPNTRYVNDTLGAQFGVASTIVQGALGINYNIA